MDEVSPILPITYLSRLIKVQATHFKWWSIAFIFYSTARYLKSFCVLQAQFFFQILHLKCKYIPTYVLHLNCPVPTFWGKAIITAKAVTHSPLKSLLSHNCAETFPDRTFSSPKCHNSGSFWNNLESKHAKSTCSPYMTRI